MFVTRTAVLGQMEIRMELWWEFEQRRNGNRCAFEAECDIHIDFDCSEYPNIFVSTKQTNKECVETSVPLKQKTVVSVSDNMLQCDNGKRNMCF